MKLCSVMNLMNVTLNSFVLHMNLDNIEAELESVPLDHVMTMVVLHLVAYAIHIVWHCNLDNVIQLQIHAITMDPDQWPNVFHMKIK